MTAENTTVESTELPQGAAPKAAQEVPVPNKKQENKVKLLHQVMNSSIAMIEFFPEEYQGVVTMQSFLKALIDKKLYVPQGKTELDIKKMAHDNYLTLAHTMTTRCKLRPKDMPPVIEAIQFAHEMANVLRAEIELIEPPAPKEPEKPLVMDLTHLKGVPNDGEETKQHQFF